MLVIRKSRGLHKRFVRRGFVNLIRGGATLNTCCLRIKQPALIKGGLNDPPEDVNEPPPPCDLVTLPVSSYIL